MRSLLAALLLTSAACDPSTHGRPAPDDGLRAAASAVAERPLAPASSVAAAGAPDDPGPVRMEVLDDGSGAPTFVMRGGPRGPRRIVFLHGMCGHGLGYAQSFQFSAAEKGTLIAPQGDLRCGRGPWAAWSPDVEALDRRIGDVFRELGEPLNDIALIGYSQGASRAEELVRRYPQRYTRLISIGAPRPPAAAGLRELRAALMMAGEHDRQDLMKRGERNLRAAGVRVTFHEIPEATHGAMGPTPEKTMGQALDWLFEGPR